MISASFEDWEIWRHDDRVVALTNLQRVRGTSATPPPQRESTTKNPQSEIPSAFSAVVRP